MALVDFVLESGNGDLENITTLSIEAQSGDDDSESAVDGPSLSPEASALPQIEHTTVEGTVGPVNQEPPQACRSLNTSYSPASVIRDTHSIERPWPLRDPEEAYLLKNFVDRISSFVSNGYLQKCALSSNCWSQV